jgi:hemerythrin-like metal-binding protein
VRYGGEEFLVLMSHTTLEGACITAEKIRRAVQDIEHPVARSVTASLGVGIHIPCESRDRWFRRIDEALYRAKERGRNRIEHSDGEEQYPSACFHIEWSHSWESGNETIDTQHKTLNDYANRIMDGALAGWQMDQMLPLIDELLMEVDSHFSFEEKAIEDAGYPDTDVHADIHRRLHKKARRLKRSYVNGFIEATSFFSFIVDDVMLDHLQNADTKFFPFTQRRD